MGFVFGLVGVFVVNDGTWPTHEMSMRGDPLGLLTGMVIAVVSGMAVALSILRCGILLPYYHTIANAGRHTENK